MSMIELVHQQLASLDWPMELDLLVFALREKVPAAKVGPLLEQLASQGRAQCDDDGWRIKIEEVKKPRQGALFV